MRLHAAEFLSAEGGPPAARWYLLYGAERQHKQEVLERLLQARLAGEDLITCVERLEGRETTARHLLQVCQTLPLLAAHRVVVVRGAEAMPAAEQRLLAGRLGQVGEHCTVVLLTREEEVAGARAALTPELHRALSAQAVVVDCAPLAGEEAVRWVQARVARRGRRLHPSAAQYLVEQRIGADLARLEGELEKLCLYVGEGGAIGREQVELLCPKQVHESVFRLLDLLVRRAPGPTLRLLRELLEQGSEQPPHILGLLARQFRLIWQAKVLADHGWRPGQQVPEQAAALLPATGGLPELLQRQRWQAQRLARQAAGLSWAELERAFAALLRCDLALKGGAGPAVTPRLALELLVVELCVSTEAVREG